MDIMEHLTIMVVSNITQFTADCKRSAGKLFYTIKCLFLSEEWEKKEPCVTVSTVLKTLRIAVEERMEDADTAPGIRSIGTDDFPTDHQYGGMVCPVTE